MTSDFSTLKDRFAAWMAAAMIVVTTSQFAAAQAPLKSFVMHDAPQPVATVAFDDAQGRSRTLADFKGKVVLLNIWATWCIPCRKEMPALDRLQGSLGGPDFEVGVVSIDRGGRDIVAKFYAETGIRNLALHIDASGQAMRTRGAVGLPTTVIINRGSNEIGRVIGPLEWDGPEIAELLRHIISMQNDEPVSPTQAFQSQPAQRDHA